MMFNLRKEKQQNHNLGKYPSVDMLHNALRHLENKDYNGAYSKICWALMKAGVQLRQNELENFNKIREVEE